MIANAGRIEQGTAAAGKAGGQTTGSSAIGGQIEQSALTGQTEAKLESVTGKTVESVNKAAYYKVSSDGMRGENTLGTVQREIAGRYLNNFDLEEVVVRYVDGANLSTGYAHGELYKLLNIGSDVVPGNVGIGTLTANSRVSIKGAIAHEIVGHREAAIAGRTLSNPLLEEAQASIRAARFAPELSSTERYTLLRDGITRLQKGGYRINDVRDLLYIKNR